MRLLIKTLFTFIIFLSCADLKYTRAERKTATDHETKRRNTDHIDDILLRPDPIGYDDTDPNTKAVLKELRTIYQNMIRPVEKQFKYADLRRHTMSDVDIYAKPIILLVGPWSTGKSTMINYLLGIEGALESLYVGAEPTTGDFTVLSYGDDYRTVEGVVLATDSTKPFASMEKFGQIFLEHLLGVEMNRPLLRNISFIDTPGILENRRQQERGYPYNDVMRWLVHRSDLIFVVFDPTKLDVGYELETLFKQLKGKESVLRIILNKADSMSEQDLMRVYGALFWSLSPLINVTEPPRVYVGSFWGEPYHDDDLAEILLREEKSLLHDMREVIRNRVYNKIAFIRQYAIRVRIHALLVDSYVTAYRRNKGLFGNGDELARQIVDDPENYDVFKTVLSHPNVSKYDLPEQEEYDEFFRINPLPDQRRMSEHCGYFSGCALDQLNKAISHDLPVLLRRFQTPNERRPKTKNLFDQTDFAQWHRDHQMAKEKEAGRKGTETEAPPGGGAKKYRKSAPVEVSEEEIDVEPVQEKKETKKKEKPQKIKAPKVEVNVPKAGKSKLKSNEEEAKSEEKIVKEQPKRRKRSKEKIDSAETDSQPKSELEPVEEPEEPKSEEQKSEEIEIEIEPPAPSPKHGRKLSPSTEKRPKEPVREPEPPKSMKKSKESIEPKSKKISGTKAAKGKISKEEAEIGAHKGTTPPPSAAADEGPKCNKYRKNCNDDAPSDVSVEKIVQPVHKGSPKKKSVDDDKKKSVSEKPVSKPAPPPASGPKCNKYRKSCQDGDDTERPVQARKMAESVPVPVAVPAPAPVSGAKCNKYRKDCNQDSDETPNLKKSIDQPKEAKKPAKKEIPAPVPVPAGSDGKKCNKYRKDCNQDSEPEDGGKKSMIKEKEEQKTQKKPKEHSPIKETVAAVVTGGKKCNKYRKSCQDGIEDAEVAAPVTKDHGKVKISSTRKDDDDDEDDDKKTTRPVRCTKYSYRISCRDQQADSDDDGKRKENEKKKPQPEKKEKRPEPVKVAASGGAPGGKCNKYRKDCQQDSESEPPAPIKTPKHVESKKVPDRKEPEAKKSSDSNLNLNFGGKCNKYRKSCRDPAETESESKPVQKTKPAVKEDGKPKKLCKKNATASAAPSATKKDQKKGSKTPTPATDSDSNGAPVPQNKWRKQKTPPSEQLVTS